MNVAIIPARGGSQRIPHKNIRPFYGKPIIAYSIEAALASQCFDRVIVSTDNDDIAEVAKHYGAEVPFKRPADISDHHSITADVIKHALVWLEQEGNRVDYACCLYATAPFVTPEVIQLGAQKIQQLNCEFVFTATEFPFPVQRAVRIDEQQRVSMFQPEHLLTRSQDLEKSYHDVGQLYWGKTSAWMTDQPIFAKHSAAIMIPRQHAQDIDTEDDWGMAEHLYALAHNTKT